MADKITWQKRCIIIQSNAKRTAVMLHSFKQAILYSCAFFIPFWIQAQTTSMIRYDLINGQIDTIKGLPYDANETKNNTPYQLGSADNHVANLPETFPSEDIFEESTFSLKKRTALDFDLLQFPIRTSVKLMTIQDDSLSYNCTGSFISPSHILTAAHCFCEQSFNIPRSMHDSILACPIYDNGNFSETFECSYATKLYTFDGWSFNGTDFAVLELEKPVGSQTGWLGIGYDENADNLQGGIYIKFSYPNSSYFQPGLYNGDTLYYSYGKIDLVEEKFIGIEHTFCDFGESGSPLIQFENDQKYINYGTLTYGINCRHNRFNQATYKPIFQIIENDLILHTIADNAYQHIHVYPNPVKNYLQVTGDQSLENMSFILYDPMGNKIMTQNNLPRLERIDFTGLENGIYFLEVYNQKIRRVLKIIKQP